MGYYELRLGLVAADDDNSSGETAAIGVIQSGPGSCPPPVEAPIIPLDARYGDTCSVCWAMNSKGVRPN